MVNPQRILVWNISPRGSLSEGIAAYRANDLITLCFKPQFVSQNLQPIICDITIDLSRNQIDFPDEKRTANQMSNSDFFIIEVALKEATPHQYDPLCRHLKGLVASMREATHFDIVFMVPRSENFLRSKSGSLAFEELSKSCEYKNIGIVVIETSSLGVEIPCDCQRCKRPELEELKALLYHKDPGPNRVSEEELINFIDILYGHFELPKKNGMTAYHAPVLVSLKRFLDDQDLADRLQRELKNEIASADFCVDFLENQGRLLQSFAEQLVDQQDERMAWRDSSALEGRNLLLVCDVLCRAYPIEERVQELRKKGVDEILVFGFAKFASYQINPNIRTKYIVSLNYQDYEAEDSCPFCQQDSKYISEEYFQKAAEKAEDFDAYTFWELVSDVEGGYHDEHWISPRTKYHHLQLVYTPPIIKKHKFGLARRIWNLLRKGGIRVQWVHYIVVTDEEQSVALAQELARIMGLNEAAVVSVKREHFAAIEQKQSTDELQQFAKDNYGHLSHFAGNVIILDQAVHHYYTFRILNRFCRAFDATALAFAVFLNRLNFSVDFNELEPGVHFVYLYQWNWPPFQWVDCPCSKEP